MKKSRRLICLLMTLAMMFVIAVPAFADGEETTNSGFIITISNSVTGSTYEAYKIFDATYNSDSSGTTYYITENSEWYSDVSNATNLFTLSAPDSQGRMQVTKASDSVTASDITSWIANNLSGKAVATSNTGNGGELELDVGSAGYYYITTTTGTTVTLDTANPTAEVIDKNQVPGSLTKSVGDGQANAQIGDTIDYTITAYVPAYNGTEKVTEYTFTDSMMYSLDLDQSSIKVQILSAGTVAEPVYTWTVADANYVKITKETNESSGVTTTFLTVTYDPSKLENYPADASIIITYQATLNGGALDNNWNKVTSSFDSNGVEVEVKTNGFHLAKVDSENKEELLYGAKFKIYDVETGGTAIQFVVETYDYYDENGEVVYTDTTYRVATDDEIKAGSTTDVIDVGYALIYGLAPETTYYLEEIKAPDGYNMLSDRVAVKGNGTRVAESEEEEEQVETRGIVSYGNVVIENESGSELPSTGGMGTPLFYIFGGTMVLCGAVVLLMTRRRMNKEL